MVEIVQFSKVKSTKNKFDKHNYLMRKFHRVASQVLLPVGVKDPEGIIDADRGDVLADGAA